MLLLLLLLLRMLLHSGNTRGGNGNCSVIRVKTRRGLPRSLLRDGVVVVYLPCGLVHVLLPNRHWRLLYTNGEKIVASGEWFGVRFHADHEQGECSSRVSRSLQQKDIFNSHRNTTGELYRVGGTLYPRVERAHKKSLKVSQTKTSTVAYR